MPQQKPEEGCESVMVDLPKYVFRSVDLHPRASLMETVQALGMEPTEQQLSDFWTNMYPVIGLGERIDCIIHNGQAQVVSVDRLLKTVSGSISREDLFRLFTYSGCLQSAFDLWRLGVRRVEKIMVRFEDMVPGQKGLLYGWYLVEGGGWASGIISYGQDGQPIEIRRSALYL